MSVFSFGTSEFILCTILICDLCTCIRMITKRLSTPFFNRSRVEIMRSDFVGFESDTRENLHESFVNSQEPIRRYGLYVALHKGCDEMGSGSDSRYYIYILQ